MTDTEWLLAELQRAILGVKTGEVDLPQAVAVASLANAVCRVRRQRLAELGYSGLEMAPKMAEDRLFSRAGITRPKAP